MLGSKDKSGAGVGFSGSSATTLISRETEVIGDVVFSGNLDIEGLVRGNVKALPGKDALVRVVDKGRVEGQIMSPSVVINGEVHGDVYSTKHLELASKARVEGNLHYALVEMEVGAEINGNIKHHSESADAGTGPGRKAPAAPPASAPAPGKPG